MCTRPKGRSEAQSSADSAAGLTSTIAAANAEAEIAKFTSKRPRRGRVPERNGINRSTTKSAASTRAMPIATLVRSIMSGHGGSPAARARAGRAAEAVTADDDRASFERIELEVSDVARRSRRHG